MNDRLYRSPNDRVIAGVAGGLATWLNLDPSLVRVAWALLAIFSGGIFVIVYIVMMIVVPLPPPGWAPSPRRAAAPGSGAVPGWQTGAAPAGAPGETRGWAPPPGSSGGATAGAPPTWYASQPGAQGAWGTGTSAPGRAPP